MRDPNTMKYLYHGTLFRHHDIIESQGILPRIGDFTKNAYGANAEGLVAAVFMADEEGLEHVVHAMVAATMDEVTEDDFEEWDIGPHQHVNDALFCKYGVVYVIEASDDFAQYGSPKEGSVEPLQAEEGDWYSFTTVKPTKSLTGGDLRAFLEQRAILPSDINAFVDEDRERASLKIR